MIPTWTHLELTPDSLRSEIAATATAPDDPTLAHTHGTPAHGDDEERGTTVTTASTIGERDGERRRRRRTFGSLRRAAASDADAIPPSSSSRSIEVHGRKQAPFYPVHSRQRERWTDGAVHRARDATGRERAYALLSRAVSRSRSPTSPSRSLALPCTPLRCSVANRCAVLRTITRGMHPRIVRVAYERHDRIPRRSTRTGLSPLSHCRLLHCEVTGATYRRDTFGALRVPYSGTRFRRDGKTDGNRTTLLSRRLFIESHYAFLPSRAAQSVRSLRFLSPGFFFFCFCFRETRTWDDADTIATVVYSERTRTERRAAAPSGGGCPAGFAAYRYSAVLH